MEPMLYHFSFTIQVYDKPAEPDCINDTVIWIGSPDEYPDLNGVKITRYWLKIEYSGGGSSKVTQESAYRKESTKGFVVTLDMYWVIKDREPSLSEKIAVDHLIENYIKGYLVGMHGEMAREAFGYAI